ncbi:hypothetical protein WN944_025794 [Citrus x changshan-huyou]|uniref:Uncharacterized protein n=1 Tax=Citrus x changshan-huyou TaxID=2935761 RepID=A0AAP0LQH9_9ROSI
MFNLFWLASLSYHDTHLFINNKRSISFLLFLFSILGKSIKRLRFIHISPYILQRFDYFLNRVFPVTHINLYVITLFLHIPLDLQE